MDDLGGFPIIFGNTHIQIQGSKIEIDLRMKNVWIKSYKCCLYTSMILLFPTRESKMCLGTPIPWTLQRLLRPKYSKVPEVLGIMLTVGLQKVITSIFQPTLKTTQQICNP